jgi:membrane protein
LFPLIILPVFPSSCDSLHATRVVEDLPLSRSLLRSTFHAFSARGARFLGAAVAFYALLSAAPLFAIVLGLVGAVFGNEQAESALWVGLAHWVSPEGVSAARVLTHRLADVGRSGGVLQVLLVVYASTRLFRALRRAINQLWGIDLEAIEGARQRSHKYLVRYGQAFALIFTAAMVASLIVVKAGYAFFASLGAPAPPLLLQVMDLVSSLALTFALFLLLLRVLPEATVRWGDAAAGALVSTCLFAVGSGFVTAYVRHKQTGDLYGAASAVVLAVLWVYYSVQVFFLGACFAGVLHARRQEESRRGAEGREAGGMR